MDTPSNRVVAATGADKVEPVLEKHREDNSPARFVESAEFLEARGKAQEWADKAIDLSQAADADGSMFAERCAKEWLAKMLDIEATILDEERASKAAADRPRGAHAMGRKPAKRRSREQPPTQATYGLPSTNNLKLRAWQRSF